MIYDAVYDMEKNNMGKNNDNRFGTVEVTQKIGISAERLRYWEKLGIVNPEYIQRGTRKFRRYSKEDIQRATLIRELVDREKYSLEGAIRKIKEQYNKMAIELTHQIL
jgi:DNA-binding transcriptional MerR regulator